MENIIKHLYKNLKKKSHRPNTIKMLVVKKKPTTILLTYLTKKLRRICSVTKSFHSQISNTWLFSEFFF